MQAFCTSIMSGRIGGGSLVIDSMRGGPVLHRFGNKFAIITDENFKAMTGLVFNCPVL
jgi:hypothetical protein